MEWENPSMEDANRSRSNHTFILCFTILAFFNSTIGDKVQAKPTIKLDKDSFNLGKLDPDGGIQKLRIQVWNTGTDMIQIDFVGSSCGCVKVESFEKNIRPNEKGEIVLALDPKETTTGQKVQRILFKTNDPEKPQLPIDLFYRVRLPEVAVSPKLINVDLSKSEIRASSGLSRNTVVVIDSWKKRLSITNIRTSPNIFTHFYDIMFSCPSCPSGSEIHVIRFDSQLSSNLTVGPFNEWIKFSTNHPKYKSITVPVTGEVVSTVKVKPKTLIFHNIPEKQQLVTKTVTIEACGENETIEIEDIRCPDSWIGFEQIPINKRRVDLKITIESPLAYSDEKTTKLFKSTAHIKIKKPDLVEKTVQIFLFCRKDK